MTEGIEMVAYLIEAASENRDANDLHWSDMDDYDASVDGVGGVESKAYQLSVDIFGQLDEPTDGKELWKRAREALEDGECLAKICESREVIEMAHGAMSKLEDKWLF